ncbi:MAG: 4-hydroxybutyryl-CoA dehydratase [Deltaproteobacteria bacterium]|nr:4-hydroxybutyryl-CoA dehydratase [Deltaproteobacteria bacterium]
MTLKTQEEYIESLRAMDIQVYMFGKRVHPIDDPILWPAMNCIAKTYELALDPRYKELMTSKSDMTGEEVNICTAFCKSPQDIVRRLKMERMVSQKTARGCVRSPGLDAMNALATVTYEIDEKYGSEYFRRLQNYVRYVQENDLSVSGAMTDAGGDRSLRPHQQADPDMAVHIVEERSDGIIVRGAKVHQTGAIHCHETIVMPLLSRTEEDKEYAVSFALPQDTKGLFHIVGRQPSDSRKLEGGDIDVGNVRYGGVESLMIFEDVFVPWDRVFMCREWEFTQSAVERFGSNHRQCYGGCKAGIADVLIGAAATIADFNGIGGARSVRDKITQMIHLNETMYACGLACSYEAVETPSGVYQVDIRMANVCKLNVTRFMYEIAWLAQDIAGGLVVTLPSEKDFRDSHLGEYIKKYLRANTDVPTEHRIRMLRLIENMTVGTNSSYTLVESLHGAGPPDALKMTIRRHTDLEFLKGLARELAGIESESQDTPVD